MLKISESKPASYAVTLRLEGRVIGPWVPELSATCETLLGQGRPLRLLLAEVEFLDAAGVALMINLQSRGVALLECPPFIAEQLHVAGRA